MGKARLSAQYLQNPTPVGGNRLSREWFKSYDFSPEREMFQHVVQSWDTGQSTEAAADFSVCTTWGLADNQWHLIDVYRDKLNYYELRKKAHALNRTWKPDRKKPPPVTHSSATSAARRMAFAAKLSHTT